MLSRVLLLTVSLGLATSTLSVPRQMWAAEEGGHHEHIGMANASPKLAEPDDFRSDLALFTLVVFLLLMVILWKFAWGPISAALDLRETTIANHLAEAQRAQEEARLMLADYERKLAGTADQVRAMLEEARRTAEHTKQEIAAEGRREAEAERLRALREIESATDAALKQLAERSADLAIDLAGRIVKTKLTKEEQSALIQEALTRFPSLTPSRS